MINKERGNFNICKTILEKMIELYNKDENKLKEYKGELDQIQNILNKNKTEHNNYMKKMMKNV